MRIWDISLKKLCRKHLLGEHAELHAIWTVLTRHKKGYSRHPETLRWQGKLKALYLKHEAIVKELSCRGYQHRSRLNAALATGSARQAKYVDSVRRQIHILRKKKCACKV